MNVVDDEGELDFYRTPAAMSRIPASLGDGDDLPTDVDAMRAVVQQLLVHRDWVAAYGLTGDDVRLGEQHLRSTEEVLGRALELAPSLAGDRAPVHRVLGICRHFALVHTALLRRAGVPARVRCGFANYFDRSKWYDHWIVERWSDDGGRWVRDDPQLDGLQRAVTKVEFDPTDQPPGEFLSGSEAWRLARAGEVDPSLFGIFDMWGLPFISGNVISDLACLNKVELLPWDRWGMMTGPFEPVPEENASALDDMADCVNGGDHAAIRKRYVSDDRLRVPPVISSFIDGRPREVRLPQPLET